MGKRVFWFGVGFGVGVGATIEGQRRVQRALRRATPDAMVHRAADSLRELARDLRVATAEGRDAMRTREAELRDVP